MPITRSADQLSQTLEEHYSEMLTSHDTITQWKGRDMLAFIEIINKTFPKTQLYGLTSVDRLVIQSENSCTSNWYVIVIGLAGEYFFEYLMPKKQAPWENAMVRGTARSLEEARKYLIIAMSQSEGWKGNFELEQLAASLV